MRVPCFPHLSRRSDEDPLRHRQLPQSPRGWFFYADKTPFLPLLESETLGNSYLVFLRPSRFGKSLWISVLEY